MKNYVEFLETVVEEVQADLESLIKQVEEQIDEIKNLREEIEHLKYINKQVTYTPINVPEIKPIGTGTNPCDYCYPNPKYRDNGIYIGDSPCQWCPHSPYKVTCETDTNINETIK